MKPHADVLKPVRSHAVGRDIQWQVCCPSCGDDNIDRDPMSASDHEAVTLHPDRDSYDSPLGTRGGYLQVSLQCLNGHHFALVLTNHKGAEFTT
jgi:hypothetical protein